MALISVTFLMYLYLVLWVCHQRKNYNSSKDFFVFPMYHVSRASVGSYVIHRLILNIWNLSFCWLRTVWPCFFLVVSAYERCGVWSLIELVLCMLPVPVEEVVVGDLDLMLWIQGTICMSQACLHVLMRRIFRNISQERERYISSFSIAWASVSSVLFLFFRTFI